MALVTGWAASRTWANLRVFIDVVSEQPQRRAAVSDQRRERESSAEFFIAIVYTSPCNPARIILRIIGSNYSLFWYM